MPLLFSRAAPVALLCAALSPLCAFQAHAGASLLVDDATLTPSGQCQVESWVRAYALGGELTAVPACNFANTEFGLGYSHYTHPRTSRLWTLGIKRLFRDFDTHDWGLGLSAGAAWDSDAVRWANWSINLPASFALDAERNVVLHANIGWIKPDGQHGGVTGGVGMEVALTPSWTLLAEVHDDHRGTSTAQFGVRRASGEAASLDLLVGQDGIQNSPWLTLGFNVSFSR
jgi:hypothetical protein